MRASTKFDQGKPPMTLVDPDFTEGLARVLGFGAGKYGRGNWQATGLAYTRVLDAAHRHLAAFERGEDLDPETGLQHMYHAAACLMFMANYVTNNREDLDDRQFKRPTAVQPVRTALASDGFRTEPTPEGGLGVPTLQQPSESRSEKEAPGEPSDQDRGQYIGLSREAQGDTSRDPLAVFADRIAVWADRVYPDRTTEVAFAKMMGEIGEVLLNPEDPLEWADLLILLVDAAKLRGIDILAAGHAKMAINEERSWNIDPETGLMSHEKGAENVAG